MQIGKKIKQLRVKQGLTQEQLANYLNVTFQAVSKWEQGSTSPDISLLPKLSTYFGITIDDLFTLNSDAHLERIENMLLNERELSSDDETYVKSYLNGLTGSEQEDKAYTLLASLYNHRAKSYHQKAYSAAVKALELDPTLKENHCMLLESKQGVFTDWNYHNHHELCDFYNSFIEKHPDDWHGYLYLLDHLIADGRLSEARKTIVELERTRGGYIVYLYKGKIEMAAGNHKKAFELYDQMVASEPDNWLVYATRADEYSKVNEYDLAIKDNFKTLEVQPKPRYIDAYECNAHLYEIQGQHDKAIEMWQSAIDIIKTEWSITFGEMIDSPQREIDRLKEILV
ncbi:MAG: helix-turn-helix domain-containing protein [Clostridiales bacterium]|nr:helix-turn-helix domain-containing protein [Clostridiales bacterium]